MAEQKASWFKRHKVVTVILAFVIVGAIASAANGTDMTKSTSSSSKPTTATDTPKAAVSEAPEPAVPAEYKSALSQANSYANSMHMSKQGVYDQLVSEYGGKFTAEAAQYGIDNVRADWNANALNKAKSYQNSMKMSPSATHDQLVSSYGEKFTAAEADYAIAHIND